MERSRCECGREKCARLGRRPLRKRRGTRAGGVKAVGAGLEWGKAKAKAFNAEAQSCGKFGSWGGWKTGLRRELREDLGIAVGGGAQR
jgi:hypothetical protein